MGISIHKDLVLYTHTNATQLDFQKRYKTMAGHVIETK